MIATNNYFREIDKVDFSALPEAFKKGHEFLVKATSNGESWTSYQSSHTIKKTIDIYLAKLNEFAEKKRKLEQKKPERKKEKKVAPNTGKKAKKAKAANKEISQWVKERIEKYSSMSVEELTKEYHELIDDLNHYKEVERQEGNVYKMTEDEREMLQVLENELSRRGEKFLPYDEKHQPDVQNEEPEKEVTLVERISEELRFIKRFVNLNGKTKTKDQILSFINSLQKAILEKRIRKTSDFAKQIKFIQDKLIEVYNTMKAKIKIELKPDTFQYLKVMTYLQEIMPSINFIKRYIGMNGRPGMKQKAKQLLDQINRAMDKGKISDSDPYITEIHELKKNLKAFTTAKAPKTLEIEKAELNGLEGILGCACQPLNGIEKRPSIMNSMDFANLQFDTLGFTGKWLELIGDPSSNFTAMVFGKPKFGKSMLCVDFAGYLARHHGKVLYVAKEEGLDMTLQKKLNDKNVAHPNLYVASELPQSLASYDFIFLDSVNKLGLKPEDLNRLRAANPAKSFIFIFQTTKGGEFRGANSFQHDVDVVIEVPEWGKAVQMGRFNQGGEMEIFDSGVAA